MDENGIYEQSYYHWQRKFRPQAYDQRKGTLPAVTEKSEVSFIEILYSPSAGGEDVPEARISHCPVAVIRTPAMSIEISEQISETLLIRSLQEVSRA